MSVIEEAYLRASSKITGRDLAKLTLELVKIPSSTWMEERASTFYADFLSKLGLEVEVEYVKSSSPNVLAKLPGRSEDSCLMLYGHIDTIPVEKCVEPGVREGRVYGRGSLDMKGGLAVNALIAKAIVEAGVELENDLWIAAGVGHEAPLGHGEGAKKIAEEIEVGKIKAESVLVCEGPIDKVVIAQGGMAIYEVKALNEALSSRHTALIPLSSNPAYWIGSLIEKLKSFDEKLKLEDEHPLIEWRPCVNIGVLSGGDFYNRLPAEVKVIGTVRWNPNKKFDVIEEEMSELIAEVSGLAVKEGVEVRLDLDLIRESSEVSEGEKLVKLLRESAESVLGRRLPIAGSRMVCDISIFTNEARVPSVSYGSMRDPGIAHSDIEYVEIKDLEEVFKVVLNLVLKYCGVRKIR